ncbi:MarR family winged helix-turn-helix transcriptional regulator [Nocardioides perillae]|uniref:DNA-binding MarR family transcriptional regulator n=1 Tax=Nocardioides perillae TaxID=1119534 RepID=A0A7Y9RQ39_9ACTN|nr:DNA-binding MarR family transcriptional regulator [Nocardioides perillae]
MKISSPGKPDEPGPHARWAARWQQTGSLTALRAAVDAGARVRRAVSRRAGLSDSEMVALEHLVREPLGPAELARRLEVTTAASTQIVDRLAARAHVERRPDPDDRRRTQVHVTTSGREEVLAHLMPMFVALARLDASFTEQERAVVERYLRGAEAAFDAGAAGELPADPT